MIPVYARVEDMLIEARKLIGDEVIYMRLLKSVKGSSIPVLLDIKQELLYIEDNIKNIMRNKKKGNFYAKVLLGDSRIKIFNIIGHGHSGVCSFDEEILAQIEAENAEDALKKCANVRRFFDERYPQTAAYLWMDTPREVKAQESPFQNKK